MEVNIQTSKTNGNGNGLLPTKKSHPVTDGSVRQVNHSIFDPMKYMLKLPKTKKVRLPNGQVRFEKTEADYLPVAARIAWFRKDHPYWAIVTEIEHLADKAVVMKATIKDMQGVVIATASIYSLKEILINQYNFALDKYFHNSEELGCC